jgi:hypothetical protein
MKPISFFCAVPLLSLAIGLASIERGHAQNPLYGIATPGSVSAFTVTNIPAGTIFPGSNPTLILTAGATYQLAIGTTPGFHPVAVTTNSSAFPPSSAAFSGAAPQSVSSGSITVTLPATNYPALLFYRCNVHGFTGLINILPPPPANEILSVTVTNIVVLTSAGVSNTWVFVPEYSSNLTSGVWAAVPAFSNTFANGTNITMFDRLEPICGDNVFLRVRQAPPP